MQLTEEEFETQYPLMINLIDPNAGWNFGQNAVGSLFETFGEELAFVHHQNQINPNTIWTLIDGDDGNQYIVSGFHFVNRVGYFVSKVPFPDNADIEVPIIFDFDDEEEEDE